MAKHTKGRWYMVHGTWKQSASCLSVMINYDWEHVCVGVSVGVGEKCER